MRSDRGSHGGDVLVAYAREHGAAAALAEAVAATLRDRGLAVDLRPAREVDAVEPYRAVVLGSAVYMGRWRREAVALLRRHRRALADRDLWLFSSGPVGDQPVDLDDPKADRWLRPPKVRALGEALGANDHAVFGGSIDEGGGLLRRRMAQGIPPGRRDRRDWGAVRQWAEQVADALDRARSG